MIELVKESIMTSTNFNIYQRTHIFYEKVKLKSTWQTFLSSTVSDLCSIGKNRFFCHRQYVLLLQLKNISRNTFSYIRKIIHTWLFDLGTRPTFSQNMEKCNFSHAADENKTQISPFPAVKISGQIYCTLLPEGPIGLIHCTASLYSLVIWAEVPFIDR